MPGQNRRCRTSPGLLPPRVFEQSAGQEKQGKTLKNRPVQIDQDDQEDINGCPNGMT